MKNETKIVAFALALLVIFLSGFGLGATKGITINHNYDGAVADANATQQTQATEATTTTQPATTTTAPATEATTTAASADTSASAGDTTSATGDTTTAASSGTSSVPGTKAEVAEAYNKAINDYKRFTGNATCKKVETIAIQAKDLPKLVESTVNSVVQKFTGTNEYSYTFTNGVDPDGRKPYDKMIPWGSADENPADVTEASLVEGTATANADGGYTMKLKFIAETSKFENGATTSEPIQHMTAMDPLNLATLEIDPIQITSADMTYPGATVEATVDGQGRLVKLTCNLPLEGSGTGGVGPIEATINIGGSMDSVYEITYA